MIIKVENVKIREDLNEAEIVKIACKNVKINFEDVQNYKIIKKSIDARNKNDIFYNYSILLELNKKIKLKNKNVEIVQNYEVEDLKYKIIEKNTKSPVIVGAGPAGLFCALTLIENGIKPIIIEQGKTVEERAKDVELFRKEGKLNTLSNVQFGEGGAGTFSDGKLTTNLHSPLCQAVINQFVKFGAPEQISYVNKPHMGTDNLVKILSNIREYIVSKGGVFYFNTKAENFEFENNHITKLICNNNEIKTSTLVLAIGHSSRDLFKTLYENKVYIEPKNFSVGLRIEHKQKMINKSQYGENTKLQLPPAEYKLAYHGDSHSCYTFCMCPGGEVIASSSEESTIVTNGMSKFARDGENANSAILVNITPEDLQREEIFSKLKKYNIEKNNPLLGMYFQKMLEEKAYELGGGAYFAPIQRVEDFLNNVKTTKIGEIKPTYLPGVIMANLNEILPKFVAETLKEGILCFDKKLKGFAYPDAILTGVETRSSSPVTIKRNERYMCNIEGIFPCGEGAGYAGGIMSACVDGIKVARAIIDVFFTNKCLQTQKFML